MPRIELLKRFRSERTRFSLSNNLMKIFQVKCAPAPWGISTCFVFKVTRGVASRLGWLAFWRPLSVELRGCRWHMIGRIIELLYIKPQPIWVPPPLHICSRCLPCRQRMSAVWQVQLMIWHHDPFAGFFFWEQQTVVCCSQSPTSVSHMNTHMWLVCSAIRVLAPFPLLLDCTRE